MSDHRRFSVRKADLNGYILVLIGLLFILDNGTILRQTGPNLALVSGKVFGVLAVGLGIYERRNPRDETQTEPAPRYLYGLAGIATVAFAVLLLLRFAGL